MTLLIFLNRFELKLICLFPSGEVQLFTFFDFDCSFNLGRQRVARKKYFVQNKQNRVF